MSAATKVPLSRVVSKTTGGGTPERDNEEYWNGGIPWATVKDFKDGVYELKAIKEEISEKGLSRSSSHLIPAGTPIICTRMAVGRIARASFPVAINQDLRALYIREDFDTDYVVSAIDSIRHRIENVSVGSTVKGISLDQLLAFEIDAPSKPEQTKIAEILSTVDRAIEQTEALIAKQQRLKTGLMQDLLTRGIDEHGRIRSEETHEFKDSPLGRIPVEWEVTTFGRVFGKHGGHIQTGPFGSQLHSYEYVSEGIPVVMPQDILSGKISTSKIARITESKANSMLRHRMRQGDIVFARRGDLSRCAVIQEDEMGWLCGTGCLLMRPPNRTLSPRWTAEIYQHQTTQLQVDISAVGSTMPNLNTGILMGLEIALPAFDEQKRIEQRLSGAERAERAMSSTLIKLRAAKTALMQDLLNGRRQVTALLDGKEEGNDNG